MNRLLLIGNGFDLAHGLKTSYCDFIKSYVSNAINVFYSQRNYNDPLIEIKYKYSGHYFNNPTESTTQTSINDLKDLTRNEYVLVTIKSQLLKQTIDRMSTINWVDLENDYFDELLRCKAKGNFEFTNVAKLNIEFDCLKSELEKYLICEQNNCSTPFSEKYVEIFRELISPEDIVTTILDGPLPENILILNFNYTKTLEKYKDACITSIPTKINYIHGELGSLENPVIFGFGDEYNKDYLAFEDLKNKELLKHIKSFGYFKAGNYHNLLRFVDMDKFQVYTLGHSLGLSDRTMLKQIFEHQNCVSIKIFYYKKSELKNDFTDKTFDISSHFSNKGLMRKKIVPFNRSQPMPQV